MTEVSWWECDYFSRISSRLCSGSNSLVVYFLPRRPWSYLYSILERVVQYLVDNNNVPLHIYTVQSKTLCPNDDDVMAKFLICRSKSSIEWHLVASIFLYVSLVPLEAIFTYWSSISKSIFLQFFCTFVGGRRWRASILECEAIIKLFLFLFPVLSSQKSEKVKLALFCYHLLSCPKMIP